jgi:hypothetical protein
MTDEIKSYDLPNAENLLPDEAEQVLNKLHAEAIADPQHPYTNKQHPQNKDFVSVMSKLHEIKTENYISPIEQACQEALDIQAEKQNKLVAEAQAEMEKLAELGFDAEEIPDDIQPFQLRGLQEQRLHAEGDFNTLMPMIEKDLQDLRLYDDLEIFKNFKATKVFDEVFMADATNKVIWKIAELNKQKYKGKK